MKKHFNRLKAGCIENIKNEVKEKIVEFTKNPTSHFSISLLGLGDSYMKNNKLDGKFDIKLLANSFKDNEKYFVAIQHNRVKYVAKGQVIQ